MATILVFSERDELAWELLGKAGELGQQMGLGVAAAALGAADPQAYVNRGAAAVYASKNNELQTFEASVYADALSQLAKQAEASVILIGSTKRGKELAGRLAQKLEAGCITDADTLELKDGQLLCTRNSFGGATVATQSITTGIQVISVNPGVGEPVESAEAGQVVEVELSLKPSRVKVVEKSDKGQGSVDIEGAEVLVCVGKGMTRQEDLKMVEELAEALGGLVACTKPIATDEKWLPEERIIGLSGKSGKPVLAICLGISGQVQFTVGIRDAKTIVAVNTDQNAFIWQMTDYGIVGDLNEVVPRLTAALKG
ncbi:MAG: electron transfer flavoprotein subunit alpha/FixB family protein [Syntrophomonadales bacterium]|jgi:electron transfer flavoprotein alpha subunit